MTAPAIENLNARRAARSGLDFTSLRTLYTLTLRQHLRGKRWIVMALLFLLPGALVVVIRATASQVPSAILEFLFGFMFIPQALLPLVALLYASGMIQDELEEQTITYLLIRPIPRWALYLTKLLATLTTTVVLTSIFTALTYAAVYVGADAHGENIPLRCAMAAAIHSLAVVCYCCLFGLMTLLTRRALVMGILYMAFFEGLLANIPMGVRLVTVIYYTRLIAYRSMAFVFIERGETTDMAAEAWQLDLLNDPHLLEHPTTSTCMTVLIVASVIFSLLAAFLCSQREFHVKTPEKA